MDWQIIQDEFDWRGCRAVQFDPLKLSGRGNVDGTRMFADGVLNCYDDGMSAEEIAEEYELDLQPVREIIAFATAKRLKEIA
jgi:uncharacterized protein (DUF433 family)